MGVKVAKFGGSSLADAKQFAKVKNILLADADRHYVVPSASATAPFTRSWG